MFMLHLRLRFAVKVMVISDKISMICASRPVAWLLPADGPFASQGPRLHLPMFSAEKRGAQLWTC